MFDTILHIATLVIFAAVLWIALRQHDKGRHGSAIFWLLWAIMLSNMMSR